MSDVFWAVCAGHVDAFAETPPEDAVLACKGAPVVPVDPVVLVDPVVPVEPVASNPSCRVRYHMHKKSIMRDRIYILIQNIFCTTIL